MNLATPKLEALGDSRDQSYWRGVQNWTVQSGFAIELRATDVYLVSENNEEQLCDITDTDKPWFKIWIAIMARHPEFHRQCRYYHP
jgi:hypothetical protein